MAPIQHIVLVKFDPSTTAEEVDALCAEFLSLGQACVHPETKKPYPLSCKGGKNHADVRVSKGFEYGFIVEFANEEDLDYYSKKDENHASFAKKLAQKLDGGVEKGLIAVDFVEGGF